MTDGMKTIREWAIAIIFASAVMYLLRLFLYAPYEVHGPSMRPTLKGEELLIVNKWIYDFSTPNYGDIIVFHTSEGRDFIKRVIGLPGDRIEIKNGVVYRNGVPLKEPYIAEKINGEFPPVTVPPGHVYVLGDNRNNSKDSREIGPVPLKDVVGRAELVIRPIDEIHLLSN